MDPASAPTSAIQKTEDYLYFDPRASGARGAGRAPGAAPLGTQASFGQRRQAFTDAVVFTVGGGNMEEYGNLLEWAKRSSQQGGGGLVGGGGGTGVKRRVVYGSTDLMNAEAFVYGELKRLGEEG